MSENSLPIDAEMYFRDDNGKRVFVPNITMAELARLQTQSQGTRIADFEYARVQVTADVGTDVADIEARFEVRLGPDKRSASIPLNLRTCQLGNQAQRIESPVGAKEGDAQEYVSQFLADSTGYRWILLKQSDSKEQPIHAITLQGKSRLTLEGNRQTLRISLPIHPCKINIKLPPGAIDERVRSEDVISKNLTTSGTELEVHTRGGEFLLSWRIENSVSDVSSIEAQSDTRYEIDDPFTSWKATTELEVRWLGSNATDEFRIDLPPGAQWRSFPKPNLERFEIRSEGVLGVVDEYDNAADSSSDMPTSDATGTASITDSEGDSSAQPALLARGTTSRSRPQRLIVRNLNPLETRSIKLTLDWEWTPGPAQDRSLVFEAMIQSPKVTNVDLHRGKIDCIFPAAYAVIYTETASAKLLQQGRVSDMFGKQQMKQQMQFKFSQQDFQLKLSFRREQSLPTVRPTYHVAVDRNKLTLTIWLDCSFNVNQQRLALGMQLDDWILQENTAKALASPKDPFSTGGDVLRVERQATDDRVYTIVGIDPEPATLGNTRRVDQVWRLVAEQSWTPDEDNQLQFRIPLLILGPASNAVVSDHGAGALIVSGDNNILLQWEETPFRGLLSDSFSTEYQRYVQPNFIRKPLAYRFQGRSETPEWKGKAELLPQAIAVSETAQLEILPNQVTVDQAFDLQVANIALVQPRIAVRSDAAEIEPLFYVDGRVTPSRLLGEYPYSEIFPFVAPTQASPQTTGETGNAARIGQRAQSNTKETPKLWRVYELIGAPELIGKSELRVRAFLDWESKTAQDSSLQGANEILLSSDESATSLAKSDAEASVDDLRTLLNVPLARPVLPANTRILRRDLGMSSDLSVDFKDVNLRNFNFTGESTDIAKRVATIDPDITSVEVQVQPVLSAGEDNELRIGESWLQTAISSDERQDRYVVRISTAAKEIQIKLPPDAELLPQPKVIVDGIIQTSVNYNLAKELFTVPLPEPEGVTDYLGERTVEIIYSVKSGLESWTNLEIDVPKIQGGQTTGRFYLQIITPKTQHLAWSPASLTPEWNWNWSGAWWYRQSARTEAQLIDLLDSAEIPPFPNSTNQYFFSGQSPSQSIHFLAIARFLLWLPIGAVAIVVTTLVMNVRFFRRPVVGLSFAVGIIVIASIAPDLSMLLGQTALLSLGLVGLILLTQAAIESRVRRRSVFSTRPSTYMESSHQASRVRSSQASIGSAQSSSVVVTGGK